MTAILEKLLALGVALAELIASVGGLAVPFLPLLAWAAFSYFAVDWIRLRATLRRGGFVAAGLLAVAGVAIAATLGGSGSQPFGPVEVSSVVRQVGWASALAVVFVLAGAAQISRQSERPPILRLVDASDDADG